MTDTFPRKARRSTSQGYEGQIEKLGVVRAGRGSTTQPPKETPPDLQTDQPEPLGTHEELQGRVVRWADGGDNGGMVEWGE